MSEKNVPEVRFRGFSGEWEKRALGDFSDVTKLAGFEFTEHVIYADVGEVIALRGLNIKNGNLVLKEVKYIDGSNFAKLNRSKLYKYDILLTYVGTIGEIAIIPQNDRFYLAPNVARIRLTSKYYSEYISQFMRNERFYKLVIFPLIATSSQPALSMENVRKFAIEIPVDSSEQTKIGEFFKNLDDLIAQNQKKYDKLENMKKACLDKMFPKDGADTPEVRFKGLSGKWEKKRLESIVDFRDDQRRPISSNTREGGAYPYYGASGIIDYVKDYLFDEELVLLSEDGANIIDRNYRVCFLAKGRYWVNNHAHVLNSKQDNCNGFICEALERLNYESYNTGTAQPKLNQEICRNIVIMVPKFEEQQQVSTFFQTLDNLITLQKTKLEKLKNIKKACLDKMFI